MSFEDKMDPRVPIDRGWAWVVLAGSFALSTVNIGTEKSYGIFFIEFLRKFNGTVAMTTVINTLFELTFCFSSVFVLNLGMKKFSVRVSVFIGITMSAVGYAISSLASGLEFLIVSQSILLGVGAALHHIPIYLLLGEYFDKRKGFANAVYTSGNSLGGVIMPPLYRYIFDEYGLSGGLIITAGIIFNSFVAAALLRPTEFYTKNTTKSRSYLDSKRIEEDDTMCDEDNISLSQEIHEHKRCRTLKEDPETLTGLIHNKKCQNDKSIDASGVEDSDRIPSPNIVRNHGDSDSDEISIHSSTGQRKPQKLPDDKHKEGRCSLSSKKIVDCRVMTNILYILFICIHCFGGVAILSGNIYISAHAKDSGLNDSCSAILVSLTNLTDFFGRIFCGFLADRSWLSPPRIIMLSQVMIGVLTQLTSFFTTFWHLVVFVAMYGFTAGMIVALFPSMLIDIVGKQRYANAMAIFLVLVGAFGATVLPVLGYFRDITKTYHFSFHAIGASSLLTAALLILFEVISKRKSRPIDLKVGSGP